MKIGIDLGGSHIAIGLVNENSEIIEKRTYYITEKENKNIQSFIINSIIHGINEILQSIHLRLEDIKMIGIATPGNPKNGVIKNVVNLGVKEFKIEEKLKEAFGNTNIIVKLQNDGKCAALAEKRYGGLKDYKDCVFLCLGTGIGGAAFINDEMLKPMRNIGFEVGHMIIKKDGEKCNCGNNGCFEAYCSKKKFKQNMSNLLHIEGYIGAPELIKKINENLDNPEVSKLLEDYIDNLAVGISNVINLLEPEAISIGGSMSHYESLILERLRAKIYSCEYLFNKENPPKIIVAQAGNDAGILGATLL